VVVKKVSTGVPCLILAIEKGGSHKERLCNPSVKCLDRVSEIASLGGYVAWGG